MDIDAVRYLWQTGAVVYSEEAQDRLWQREVSRANIGEALRSGWIAEERPGKPYRKCRVTGWANREVAGVPIGSQLLNVACAVSEELHVITVFWEENA